MARAVLVPLVLAACQHPAPKVVAPAAHEAPALAARLDPVVERAVADGRIVGVVVLVARDGRLVYHRAAGLADREEKRPISEDAIFRLASMSKPIVSAAALALVDEGKLRLDDPVTRWLPEFRPKLPDGREAKITVRHLITHTAGLSYGFMEPPDSPYHKAKVSDGLAEPGLSFDENARRIASAPLLCEPGTAWHYSLAIDVLGGVVERAGGAPLPDVVRRTVTGPLGLADTGFTVAERDRPRVATPYGAGKPPARMSDPYVMPFFEGSLTFAPSRMFEPGSYPSGGAGMVGTARDYLRFAEAIRTGGAPILRAETARAMTSNQIGKIEVIMGPGWGFGLGVGVALDAAKAAPQAVGSWGWGGVYGTDFTVDPVARLTIVIMTNVAGEAAMSFPAEVQKAVYGP